MQQSIIKVIILSYYIRFLYNQKRKEILEINNFHKSNIIFYYQIFYILFISVDNTLIEDQIESQIM